MADSLFRQSLYVVWLLSLYNPQCDIEFNHRTCAVPFKCEVLLMDSDYTEWEGQIRQCRLTSLRCSNLNQAYVHVRSSEQF